MAAGARPPREAAIATRMARPEGDRVVPHLGETPFCEKPPLYYWLAMAPIRLLGAGPEIPLVPEYSSPRIPEKRCGVLTYFPKPG